MLDSGGASVPRTVLRVILIAGAGSSAQADCAAWRCEARVGRDNLPHLGLSLPVRRVCRCQSGSNQVWNFVLTLGRASAPIQAPISADRRRCKAAPTTMAHQDDSRLQVRPRRCLMATLVRATQRWEPIRQRTASSGRPPAPFRGNSWLARCQPAQEHSTRLRSERP